MLKLQKVVPAARIPSRSRGQVMMLWVGPEPLHCAGRYAILGVWNLRFPESARLR